MAGPAATSWQQQQQAATRQQQARQALAIAAPALAKLELAQLAAQLRPLERQQEQTAGLSKPGSGSVK